MDFIAQRLELLRRRMAEKGIGTLLISQADNRRYFSNFTGSAGALLITPQRALLATDFRYVEQAKAQAPDFEVIQIRGELHHWLPGLVSSDSLAVLGFESDDIPYAAYIQLEEALSNSVRLVPLQGLGMDIRAIKDARELGFIEQAVALADQALAYAATLLRPGLTEKAVAWELEKFLRERGSESLPFDIIVASGPNAALPHHHPSDRPIARGEPVIIDLGARVEGYASDLTRTFCLGTPDENYRKVYSTVLRAQQEAMAGVMPGLTGSQVDALGRSIIQEAGYGEAFGHGLGHGVGMATHEVPRLGTGSQDIIQPGMAFTIEPGIYLPGWGGVRIEDDVALEEGGCRVLSRASREGIL